MAKPHPTRTLPRAVPALPELIAPVGPLAPFARRERTKPARALHPAPRALLASTSLTRRPQPTFTRPVPRVPRGPNLRTMATLFLITMPPTIAYSAVQVTTAPILVRQNAPSVKTTKSQEQGLALVALALLAMTAPPELSHVMKESIAMATQTACVWHVL